MSTNAARVRAAQMSGLRHELETAQLEIERLGVLLAEKDAKLDEYSERIVKFAAELQKLKEERRQVRASLIHAATTLQDDDGEA